MKNTYKFSGQIEITDPIAYSGSATLPPLPIIDDIGTTAEYIAVIQEV